MTPKILGTLALAVALTVGASAAQTNPAAGKTTSVTGVVTSVTPSSLAIEGKGKTMTFKIDSSTKLLARGSTAKTTERKAAGAPGLSITDMVKPGAQVTVKYMKTGDTMTASQVSVASR